MSSWGKKISRKPTALSNSGPLRGQELMSRPEINGIGIPDSIRIQIPVHPGLPCTRTFFVSCFALVKDLCVMLQQMSSKHIDLRHFRHLAMGLWVHVLVYCMPNKL